MKKNKLSVTLVKSGIGRKPSHRATLVGLGLRRLHQTVELDNTKEIQGMLNSVSFLVKVVEST